MAVSSEYIEYILDQLASAGPVTARRMFGGAGLFHEGLFFALISDDTLYFKVDDSNRPDFETAGMGPFRPFGEKSYAMSYYEVPIEVVEEGDTLTVWAEKALDVARRASTGSRKKRVKRKG
ncbi:MAG: TfoX/Sxy family protein [Thermodesulfobacteriota bacterium]